MSKFNEEKQIKRLKDFRLQEEEDLAKILSEKYNIRYADLSTTPINTNALKIISEGEAKKNKLAVFDLLNKKIKVAVISPANLATQKSIQKLEERGYQPTIFMVSNQSLKKAWDRYKDISFSVKTKEGLLEINENNLNQITEELKNLDKIKEVLNKILKSGTTNKISRFFDNILASALSLDASDIHIEPEENFTRLRFRLDGVLIEITKFERKTYNHLLSRIKLLSGLKLNIKNNSQDGRFSIKIDNTEIEIRTSTIPGAYGESIVLRILNPESISVPLEKLGIDPELLKILKEEIKKPNGMILNTGPTGSGKTTTLYAFLNKIYTPEIKIITIEDPIEYHLAGITQTQTNKEKGYTFAQGLKSALRQDPDIIMVGEIRDNETADIAVNSALTGHLVLSTLHTNNAAGTFPRFVDLGIDPKILGSSINITMAQRLVRKLCQNCKQEIKIEGENKKIIDKIVESIPDKKKYKIERNEKMFKAVGCNKCNNTGYKGRIGIFEAILVDEEIEKIIREYPSEREIKKISIKQEILNMKQDGVIKILKGITSLAELKRVIELEEI